MLSFSTLLELENEWKLLYFTKQANCCKLVMKTLLVFACVVIVDKFYCRRQYFNMTGDQNNLQIIWELNSIFGQFCYIGMTQISRPLIFLLIFNSPPIWIEEDKLFFFPPLHTN